MKVQIICPLCREGVTTVAPEQLGRRGLCPKCHNRICLVDVHGQARSIRLAGHARVGLIANSTKSFVGKLVRVRQDVAERLCGSSNEVTVFVWLKERDGKVAVEANDLQLGQLPANDGRRYLDNQIHKDGRVFLATAARIFSGDGKPSALIDLPCLEKPSLPPPEDLPLSFVDNELRDVAGSAEGVYSLRIQNLNVRETMRYLVIPDDYVHEFEHGIRHRFPNVKVPSAPSVFFRGNSVVWTSSDGVYGVELDLSNDRVRVSKVQRLSPGFFRYAGTQDPRIWLDLDVKWF